MICPFLLELLDVSSIRNQLERKRKIKISLIVLAILVAIPMVIMDVRQGNRDSENTTQGKENTDYLVEREKERSLQDSIYTYYGIVRDINGREVEGALVWISLSTETIETAPTMITSSGGGFVFEDLKARMNDMFRVTVVCTGYEKYSEQHEILGRSDTITLIPASDD